ncbi:hypothetical protein VSR68_36475 [Paraburkholderia phymatum]|uniref:hypothetical protein n=1 Tax=Paraburkholderia phymatum TaxID=148447 RepID=UPI00316FFEF1
MKIVELINTTPDTSTVAISRVAVNTLMSFMLLPLPMPPTILRESLNMGGTNPTRG